jgi:hypothetical protein
MNGLNGVTVEAFESDRFKKALLQAASPGSPTPSDQVEYLAKYCLELGARSVVKERHYIDRHYIDEYAFYYSRTLAPPANSVSRFHVFSCELDDQELLAQMEAALASNEAREVIQEKLCESYLGFISIRPIPSVPVGRTVLRRIKDEPGKPRDIWATSLHDVHLANLTLRIDGLAFQQQDVAVGACATAALWSALSRVARFDGMRAPTPAEVSEAAARHVLANGRSIPASAGLTIEQLSEASRSCGFAPEVFRVSEYPELFMVAVHSYLLSGIPVVLGLGSHGGGHAVTAVGFQAIGAPHPVLQTSIPVRSARIKKLYVHDDRLGPYARSFPKPLPVSMVDGEILPPALGFEIESETWLINSALVPVYPKLRLGVKSLITLGELTGDLVETVVGQPNAFDLSVEFLYKRSGEYLRDLSGRVRSEGSGRFLSTVMLSRWCGIVRWWLKEQQLVEFIYDTTDILRRYEVHGGGLLRGIVNISPAYSEPFEAVAQHFGVPVLA